MKQTEAIPAGNEWVTANIREFQGSPVKRIGDDWMLISAGDVSRDRGRWNTMTASWGGLGTLWSTDTAFCFIRPSRYTFTLINESSVFSLSFFPPEYHQALEICGSASGRDTDKALQAKLSPVFFEDGAIGFKEAAEVIICRKLYTHDFDSARFLAPEIEKNYLSGDYHRMFIGKVTALRIRKE